MTSRILHGSLLAEAFLCDGVTATWAWKSVDEAALSAFAARVASILAKYAASADLNEAATEQEIILPILNALGWEHTLPQQAASKAKREDVPDILLFADAESKRRSVEAPRQEERYRSGLAFVESKRLGRRLDAPRGVDSFDSDSPTAQMLRYLTRVDAVSGRQVQWGILTNGHDWRLYWQQAPNRSEDYLGVNLGHLLHLAQAPALPVEGIADPLHYWRLFHLLFGRPAFLPDPSSSQGHTFLQIAREESRLWEARVAASMSDVVFNEVFPGLVRSLIANDAGAPPDLNREYLEKVRTAALTFLYRLLFVFYAEDRNLLPVRDARYREYSVLRLREHARDAIDKGQVLSTKARASYQRLADLFRAIDEGDDGLGLPPYNGGLFQPGAAPLLNRASLSDAQLLPLIDKLGREAEGAARRWVNYRDLSVSQLGSIYERLLEFRLTAAEGGQVLVTLSPFARKGSGSYYTHDALVRLTVAKTLEPLIAERAQANAAASASGDPASALLSLRVCDPAMGSGHFLVNVVDFLANKTLEALDKQSGPSTVAGSSVQDRVSAIRAEILSRARQRGWTVDEDLLDDRHIVRRMILKSVIYGVDKNPMAVELAKVSLWLHTFTVGAPLSFLDHHLRCGDALFGETVLSADARMAKQGELLQMGSRKALTAAAQEMNAVSQLTDADIAEVQSSREHFERAQREIEPLWKRLDFWETVSWFETRGKPAEKDEIAGDKLLKEIVDGARGSLDKFLASGDLDDPKASAADRETAGRLHQMVGHVANQEHFFHWDLAFPEIWRPNGNGTNHRGFDAVIGNPPWERMKLQEVEWFAERIPEIAKAQRAADRKKAIEKLAAADAGLYRAYLRAKERAEIQSALARSTGDYPLLSKGDINYYSLFVERAFWLGKPDAVVGLVVPSGIAADKGASEFFQTLSKPGRLAYLLDFENKKFFFPDVHASFKFSIMVCGGVERTFPGTWCAAFLHSTKEAEDPEKVFKLSADDFQLLNPNTGTAPVFRTLRDAEITRRIYRTNPVLVDRREDPPNYAWKFDYLRMFDMTNDSGLFLTAKELEKDGAYRVAPDRWKKGVEEFVPLYEGKMIQMYNHRAASVEVDKKRQHRPGVSVEAGKGDLASIRWMPVPQFWIRDTAIPKAILKRWAIGFKDVTAPTNARTMIASLVPGYGFGNTLPIFIVNAKNARARAIDSSILLGNLNCLAFDFVARNKIQGQHVNLYILEQCSVVSIGAFTRLQRSFKIKDLQNFIVNQVLCLSYTSVHLKSFAKDLGYDGPPFKWDAEDRRHRMARLDAIYFHLYGLTREDADYILGTFPIVREKDEAEFGRFRTRDLILGYMNTVAAGDLESVIDA